MRLGIDFGTCYSSAALLIDNTLKTVKEPLRHGYSFPSSVYITEVGEILIGQAAENSWQKDPQRYRREFKRDLGSSDPYALGDRMILPEELVAKAIEKLKSEADKMVQGLGYDPLTEAILTIPATYTLYKRQLMEQASLQAGFDRVELLQEPVAAAIYYSQNSKLVRGDIVLIYDLGGGTFDATLIQKQDSGYQMLGIPRGLPDCGGTDFDRLIYRNLKTCCSQDLCQQLENPEGWRTRITVSEQCRDLKHQLSEQQEATIYLRTGLDTVESYSLTQKAFNSIISLLVEETIDCCDQLVKSAAIEWSQINQVLLVGGSCRIPYIKEIVAEKWGKTPIQVDDPELAVCFGAAIYGASQLNDQQDKQEEFKRKQQQDIKHQLEEESRRKQEQEIERQRKVEEIYQKGQFFYKQRDYDQAIACYRQVLELNPNHLDCLLNLGIVFKAQGKLEDAIAQYQKALEIDPNQAKVRHNLANILKSQGKLDQAIREYRKAIIIDSNHAYLHCNLGLALQAQGKLEEAIAEYQTALKIDSNHAISHRALGIAWYSQGKYAEAIAEYQTALQIDPSHADTHCNLAMALQVQRKYAEAIAEYQTALQINPNHTNARSNLKILETKLQKKQQKDKDDRSNSHTNFDLEQTFQQGLINLQQEKYSAARENFDRIIQNNSNSEIAYFYRGLTYFYLDYYQKTIEDCDKSLQLNPNYNDAHLCRGFALFCLGKNQEAIQAFNHILQIDKDQAGAYLGRSLTYVSLNQHQRAIADLNQLRKIASNFNVNEYNQILTEFVQGNKKEIVNYLKKVANSFIIETNLKQHFSEDNSYQKQSDSHLQKISKNYQNFSDYLSQIILQFQAEKFKCDKNINYHNYTFACVAEGRKTIALIQPLKTFFIFAEFDSIDITELRKFTRESFNYCGEKRKQELIKLTGFLCYPIAVVKKIDPSTVEALRQEPPNCETSLFTSYSYAFPIMFDLTSMKLYFSEQRPFLGWAVWPSIKKISQEMLI